MATKRALPFCAPDDTAKWTRTPRQWKLRDRQLLSWGTSMRFTSCSQIRTPKILVLAAALIAPTVSIAANPQAASNEARTERYFQTIRKDPNQLLVFLRAMPKGGDLH